MGFPVGYMEVFLPKLFVYTLSFLGFIRNLIVSLSDCLGLSDFLDTDAVWPENPTRATTGNPPVSAVLIREILPVINCAVCLYEFEGGEDIRWLTNCRHVFHRACLDRWMDHNQKTCPLCRTSFVPDELQDEFNQRLWAASGVNDFYSDYSTVPGL
ncbi:hypothetical protein ES332_A07G164000v1 [Gossypium tomentosum]|uniref:RING-type domain-containing protein n=1 Tax=Gossypium tomentosum TaxID=34277 RepID=A0A5D2PWQ4_GOSTO|nr:hypothetical protein ES332_A07G164000v1 [Gossypium tomentosum]